MLLLCINLMKGDNIRVRNASGNVFLLQECAAKVTWFMENQLVILVSQLAQFFNHNDWA